MACVGNVFQRTTKTFTCSNTCLQCQEEVICQIYGIACILAIYAFLKLLKFLNARGYSQIWKSVSCTTKTFSSVQKLQIFLKRMLSILKKNQFALQQRFCMLIKEVIRNGIQCYIDIWCYLINICY